jgi:hypothetical protein
LAYQQPAAAVMQQDKSIHPALCAVAPTKGFAATTLIFPCKSISLNISLIRSRKTLFFAPNDYRSFYISL